MERASVIILPAAVHVLVTRSWEYSYRHLWSKCVLSDDAVCNIKNRIASYYWSIDPAEFQDRAEEYFQMFCKSVSEIESRSQFAIDLFLFSNTLTA